VGGISVWEPPLNIFTVFVQHSLRVAVFAQTHTLSESFSRFDHFVELLLRQAFRKARGEGGHGPTPEEGLEGAGLIRKRA
jgi:hypothetical protein